MKRGVKKGYFYLMLQEEGKSLVSQIHRLVALTWIGPEPFPKSLVRHLDDNQKNNHFSNLSWGTDQNNVDDAVKNGRYFGRAIKSFEMLKAIYLASRIKKLWEVAEEFNVKVETVSDVKNKLRWKLLTDQIDQELEDACTDARKNV